jgi:hypothetical protein
MYSKDNTIHISLGSDCSIAYQLSKHKLRQEAYPFDWILTPKLSNVIKCIENEFEGFLDNLESVKETNTYPKIEEDWIDSPSELIKVINLYYRFSFVHDFKTMDDLEEVRSKYKRRIERFSKIMKDVTIKKKLYRIGKKSDNVEELCKVFDKLGYCNYKIKFISYDKFSVVDSEGDADGWKRDTFDWLECFCMD